MEDNTTFTDTVQSDIPVADSSISSVENPEFQDSASENPVSPEENEVSSEVTETPVPPAEPVKEITSASDDEVQQESEDFSQDFKDIQKLLAEMQKEQAEYNASSLEFQTQITEEHQYFMEQSKNVLSVLVVIALILGFASGIILARLVWRKI